jgi:hypothetical protein
MPLSNQYGRANLERGKYMCCMRDPYVILPPVLVSRTCVEPFLLMRSTDVSLQIR